MTAAGRKRLSVLLKKRWAAGKMEGERRGLRHNSCWFSARIAARLLSQRRREAVSAACPPLCGVTCSRVVVGDFLPRSTIVHPGIGADDFAATVLAMMHVVTIALATCRQNTFRFAEIWRMLRALQRRPWSQVRRTNRSSGVLRGHRRVVGRAVPAVRLSLKS